MNKVDPFCHLKQFAAHQNVQIAAVDKKLIKNLNPGVVVLKKLDIAHLSSEKLKKYHQEGRIVFILDGQQVQFNKTFANKHLVDLDVCQLKVRPVTRNIENLESDETEILENVAVEHLNQEEYDEIMALCQEVLSSFKKEKEGELQGKFIEVKGYDSSVRLALKHLLMLNVMGEMSQIVKRFIESMERAREEESAQAKADQKKQQELKERLTKERLNQDVVKKEIEKNTIEKAEKLDTVISDEKRVSLGKKLGKPISEHQS